MTVNVPSDDRVRDGFDRLVGLPLRYGAMSLLPAALRNRGGFFERWGGPRGDDNDGVRLS
jgi:hypothetical protein